jgi:hypothetical protein
MVNEMRKLHLELKAQQRERQSPTLQQFLGNIMAGTDQNLISLGDALEMRGVYQNPESEPPHIGPTIDRYVGVFESDYAKLSAHEKQQAAAAMQGRTQLLENILSSDVSHNHGDVVPSRKALRGLKYLSEKLLGENNISP